MYPKFNSGLLVIGCTKGTDRQTEEMQMQSEGHGPFFTHLSLTIAAYRARFGGKPIADIDICAETDAQTRMASMENPDTQIPQSQKHYIIQMNMFLRTSQCRRWLLCLQLLMLLGRQDILLTPTPSLEVTWAQHHVTAIDTLGSRPPTCRNKCHSCSPCEAIQVPTDLRNKVQYSNYEPEGWKCKCRDRIFNP
eukprot:Gb_30138 [translate_table: standard]